MTKSSVVLAAVLFSTAGLACDKTGTVAGTGTMDGFRDRAMAQLRSESLDSLRNSLQSSQTALSADTRERFLAQQAGSPSGATTARGAP